MRASLLLSLATSCVIAAMAACHGKLPPTQPPRANGDEPAMRTNDAPLVGPVATASADAAPAAPILPAGAGGGVAH